MIEIQNDGPLIAATNYWASEMAASKMFVSVNSGAIRVLLPNGWDAPLQAMRMAEYCVLSRGPWAEMQQPEAVEILFEDHTDTPFALHLGAGSFDVLPASPKGRRWRLSVWTAGPVKQLDLACHWRMVPRIPWLKPLCIPTS